MSFSEYIINEYTIGFYIISLQDLVRHNLTHPSCVKTLETWFPQMYQEWQWFYNTPL